MGEVQSARSFVMVQLLWKRIGSLCEPADCHANRAILPLDIAALAVSQQRKFRTLPGPQRDTSARPSKLAALVRHQGLTAAFTHDNHSCGPNQFFVMGQVRLERK